MYQSLGYDRTPFSEPEASKKTPSREPMVLISFKFTSSDARYRLITSVCWTFSLFQKQEEFTKQNMRQRNNMSEVVGVRDSRKAVYYCSKHEEQVFVGNGLDRRNSVYGWFNSFEESCLLLLKTLWARRLTHCSPVVEITVVWHGEVVATLK